MSYPKILSVIDNKIDKIIDATQDNILISKSNGIIADSGINIYDVEKVVNSVNKVIDVSQHELYDVNNVSASLNDICNNINVGDTVILRANRVYTTSTINLGIPKYANIILDAEIVVTGDFNGVEVYGGEFFNLYIKAINHITPENYLSNTSRGLRIHAYRTITGFSNIKVDEISGFNKGLDLKATDNPISIIGAGIQANKFLFSYIHNCNIGIYFDATRYNGGNWINENTFIGGSISSVNTGISSAVITGHEEDDIYNSNKFYNIDFESIANYAIDIHQFRGNLFKGIRLYHQLEGLPATGAWVKESINCYFNTYELSHAVDYTRFDLGYRSRVLASLSDPSDSFRIISTEATSEWSNIKAKNVLCFKPMFDNYYFSEEDFARENGTINQSRCCTYIDVKLLTTTRVLNILPCLEFPGNQIIITVKTNGGYLNVKFPSNQSGIYLLGGVYKLSYTFDTWNKVTMSEYSF